MPAEYHKVEVNCVQCGQPFHAKLAHRKRGWGRYCSRACQYEGFKRGVTTACQVCEREVYRSPSEFKNSKSGKFFCDKSCQTKWRNLQYTGEKHRNWKAGASVHYRAMLKRTGMVQQCGWCKTTDTRILAAHHLDHDRKNNSKENLRWLCHSCHWLIHNDSVIRHKFMVAMV